MSGRVRQEPRGDRCHVVTGNPCQFCLAVAERKNDRVLAGNTVGRKADQVFQEEPAAKMYRANLRPVEDALRKPMIAAHRAWMVLARHHDRYVHDARDPRLARGGGEIRCRLEQAIRERKTKERALDPGHCRPEARQLHEIADDDFRSGGLEPGRAVVFSPDQGANRNPGLLQKADEVGA